MGNETDRGLALQFLLHQQKIGVHHLSSDKMAANTLNFFKKIIASGKCRSAKELLKLLESEKKNLTEALPHHFVAHNILLTVIKVICDENGRSFGVSGNFMPNELYATSCTGKEDTNTRKIQDLVVSAISDLLTELSSCVENLCSQAADHICATDVIITHSLSFSFILSSFFKKARKNQKFFRVLTVDDGADDGECLSSVDVLTAMQRATRVLVAAVVVFPDGSCLAPAGCLIMCLAAKRHAVPVYVCAAFYKFAPYFVADVERVISFGSSTDLVSSSEIDELKGVELINPLYDYIPADLISLYISHTSAFRPSHVYRFVEDYYCRDHIGMSL